MPWNAESRKGNKIFFPERCGCVQKDIDPKYRHAKSASWVLGYLPSWNQYQTTVLIFIRNSSMCFGPQEPKQIKLLLQMKDQHHLGTILTGNYGSISTFLEPDLVTADFPSCGLNEATIFGLSHNITTADIFLVLQTHIGIYSVGAARSKSRCSYQSKHKVCSVAF